MAKKKKQLSRVLKEITSSEKVGFSTIDNDCLPYACHYDVNTILTKNGELMQTIKVTGFLSEYVENSKNDDADSVKTTLRSAVRSAIAQNIQDDKFAIWFHTIRRKKSIVISSVYDSTFATNLNDAWNDLNDWDNQYINELYITVLIEGMNLSIKNPKNFFYGLSKNILYKKHENFLKKESAALNKAVNGILNDLKQYVAHRLCIAQRDNVFYSEQMRFLGKIWNLCDEEYQVSVQDMSSAINKSALAFGFNIIGARNDNKNYFAAIFTVKEYTEISVDAIDLFLQLPQELIVSQSLNFIDVDDALTVFEYQKYILEISGDNEFAHDSGIVDIVKNNNNLPTDYGNHQLSITLIAGSKSELQAKIDNFVIKIADIGIMVVREDVRMEECFYSNLPGNFYFLCRQKPINIDRVGGFASLYNFPSGRAHNNQWGDALCLFRTASNTPYFFNFHDGTNGNTLIVGPNGKTIMTNFLLAQATKYKPKIFILDVFQSAKPFVLAIDGFYRKVSHDKAHNNARLNPFLVTERKQEIYDRLLAWLKELPLLTKTAVDKKEVDNILIIAKEIFEQGNKLNIKDICRGTVLEKMINFWTGPSKLSHIFNPESDDFAVNNDVKAFDLTDIADMKVLLIPILHYLMYKIQSSLDNRPTIVVINEAWQLFNNELLVKKLNSWIRYLTNRNAIVIFTTESTETITEDNEKLHNIIMQNSATEIYLSNPEAREECKTHFLLSDNEFRLIKTIDHRLFLLKKGEDSVVAKLDLSTIPDKLAILSGNEEVASAIESVIENIGSIKSSDWLPAFENLTKQFLENNEPAA